MHGQHLAAVARPTTRPKKKTAIILKKKLLNLKSAFYTQDVFVAKQFLQLVKKVEIYICIQVFLINNCYNFEGRVIHLCQSVFYASIKKVTFLSFSRSF